MRKKVSRNFFFALFVMTWVSACGSGHKELSTVLVGYWEVESRSSSRTYQWCSKYGEDGSLRMIGKISFDKPEEDEAGESQALDAAYAATNISWKMVKGVWTVKPGKRLRHYGGHKILGGQMLSDEVKQLAKVDNSHLVTSFSSNQIKYRSADLDKKEVYTMRRVEGCEEFEAAVSKLPVLNKAPYAEE